jgi:hypothetical protein
MLGDRRVRLLELILNCGNDVNRQSHDISYCVQSVWQKWLRDVCLRLKRYRNESEKSEQPITSSSDSKHIKIVISDIVAALLYHDADPTGSTCIYRCYNGEACQLLPLESVLERFAAQSSPHKLQVLRLIHSG